MRQHQSSWDVPARDFAKGIGEAVAARTVSRKKPDGHLEKWSDVSYRVALGNTMLHPADAGFEFDRMHAHLRQASVLMSGRHLQHGDATQPTRNQEVFTNCSTSASTFILFYLLLNGSGVGRCYDDDMMLVDWSRNMPHVVPIIREDHADVLTGEIAGTFVHPVFPEGKPSYEVLEVPDSREGWAKAIEKIEFMTWEGTHADTVLLIDFSHVRPRGAPINGMQGRPASGPGPLMNAIAAIATLKDSGLDAWEATLTTDHYAAECVLVGGARRAARMSTKTWRDKSVLEFIRVKAGGTKLWSSNNSVTVDQEFWDAVNLYEEDSETFAYAASALQRHAVAVFEALCSAAYHDGTGEPGLINVDMLEQKDEGIEALMDGRYAESARFKLRPETLAMTAAIAKVFATKPYMQITNPCGEISLALIGGYCVIADVVPYHAASDDNAEEAFRVATRALIRTNLMDCVYSKEVKRTNRIGVGITGLHEYAWARFGLGWKEMVSKELSDNALAFWHMLARFSYAVADEAKIYSAKLGVVCPHTALTMKPAGTTSKLFGLTEGAHLPSMGEFLRWVQFRYDDPLVAQYEALGYPVRKDLKTYTGTHIVGFPTVPEICKLGMGDKLVTAADATPEEQYRFLQLMEYFYIDGMKGHGMGNQVSYTLKYKPHVTSYREFRRTLLDGQSTVKCCSVMPQGDTSAYEYQPEQPVTPEEFAAIVAGITDDSMKEDIGLEHVECAGGACPIDFAAQAA